MIDVSKKPVSYRKAQAQGQIKMSRQAFEALKNKTNPKGDVLAVAEVAGIIAAKKTSDLIPFCHPLPLEQVQIEFRLEEEECSVTAVCCVSATAKTGVEMEALSGVNGALLCIYDLTKILDPILTISNIRLNFKRGGKSGTWKHPHFEETSPSLALQGVLAGVITVSDRAAARTIDDEAGPATVKILNYLGCSLSETLIVPDEKIQIQSAIRHLIQEKGVQLIITTGGTGLSPRDRTPEAIQEISDRIIPGFGEYLRSQGAHFTPSAWLSCSLGAILGKTLVIALPGSPRAVKEGLTALQDFLPHALHITQGGNHASN